MTTPTHPAAHLALAMKAVARHMIDHRLPEPRSIRIGSGLRNIEVHVGADGCEAWVESIAVDEVTTHGHEYGGRWAEHTETAGRIGLGVRVLVKKVEFRALPAGVSA